MISDHLQGDVRCLKVHHRSYLSNFKDGEYRDQVFSYIEKEDTPRPIMYQLDLMRKVGFRKVDILHKNLNFAAFGGVK